MYYLSEVSAVVRVMPKEITFEVDKVIEKRVREEYEGQISEKLGRVVLVTRVIDIGEGVVIYGDGAAYYKVIFECIHYQPELQEIVFGKVSDIAEYGAFVDFGPFEGLVHISQSMEDFVSYDKSGQLTGKETKKSVKLKDKVRAKIIAISKKDATNPKIGLTMRQVGLGKPEWELLEVKKRVVLREEKVQKEKK